MVRALVAGAPLVVVVLTGGADVVGVPVGLVLLSAAVADGAPDEPIVVAGVPVTPGVGVPGVGVPSRAAEAGIPVTTS